MSAAHDPVKPATAPPATMEAISSRRLENPRLATLWLHRLSMIALVFVCAGLGMLLVILPWSPQWSDNHLLLESPTLQTVLTSGFVRGVCSGLGFLDLWAGFWEAVHYREEKRL